MELMSGHFYRDIRNTRNPNLENPTWPTGTHRIVRFNPLVFEIDDSTSPM